MHVRFGGGFTVEDPYPTERPKERVTGTHPLSAPLPPNLLRSSPPPPLSLYFFRMKKKREKIGGCFASSSTFSERKRRIRGAGSLLLLLFLKEKEELGRGAFEAKLFVFLLLFMPNPPPFFLLLFVLPAFLSPHLTTYGVRCGERKAGQKSRRKGGDRGGND